MALNFKTGTIQQDSISSSSNTDAIDLAGYSKLSSFVKFGTCTGSAGSSGQLALQTSPDNSSWATITGDVVADTIGDTLSGNSYHKYHPDNATADETGFARYIRYRMIITGTPSLTYTIYWHAKE